MTLIAGDRLGPYEILAPLGAGGMGEVYRARDARLGRDVAIKTLPDLFAHDTERLARFEREARLLAQLQHTNIAGIFGLEEAQGHRYLVLELVEGETLESRLSRGALPVDEALEVCTQVAAAVEAAHEAGVIHRDLKPGNVMLRPDGVVKVLDFGLARGPEAADATGDLSQSPTRTSPATVVGVILGTAAYMSPEQARGRVVDRRADIWSFGCVLYECLTGKQAFAGETASDTIAAILRAEPDWAALPAATPQRLRALLARCLRKDPRERLRDLGDARLELAEIQAGGAAAIDPAAVVAVRAPAWRSALPWAVAAIALVVAGYTLTRRGAPMPSATELSVMLPSTRRLGEDIGYHFFALAPDGRSIAYASREGGHMTLRLRRLDRRDDVELDGTEGARNIFFSPDGEWIAFFNSLKLCKVSVQGGLPVVLADAGQDRLGTWLDDGTIVYSAETTSPLQRIPSAGGTPVAITTIDVAKKERTHRFPCALAGGPWVVFTVGRTDSPGGYDDSPIDAVNVKTGERRRLVQGARRAIWAPPGYLLFARASDLYAMPIDPRDPKPSGEPVPVLEGVAGEASSGAAFFDVSRHDGTLAWISADERASQRQIGWFDRAGHWTPTSIPPGEYRKLELSPDANRTLVLAGPGGGSWDVWLADLATSGMNRLTFNSAGGVMVWMPDGTHLVHARSDPNGGTSLVARRLDGAGADHVIHQVAWPLWVTSVTPDGRRVVFSDYGRPQGRVYTASVDGDPDVRELAADPGNTMSEQAGMVSPDGRWLAYISSRTRREEVCVRAFDGNGGHWQVSTGGGGGVRWGRDSHELFFVKGETLMRVALEPRDNELGIGHPEPMFDVPPSPVESTFRDYAYDRVHDRFLFTRPPLGSNERREIALSLGWTSRLARQIHERKTAK